MPVAPELRERLSQAEIGLARVSDRVYRQERSCNSYLVKTATGSVLIDPAASGRTSPLRRLAERFPPRAVLLTHAHRDHLSGLAEWTSGSPIPIVAQREHQAVLAGFERLAGFFARRNAALDGASPAANDGRDRPRPTLVFSDAHVLDVDGLRLELTHDSGETPDHASIWIPELRALAVGDNFYDSFPNIGTPRGSAPRFALDYVAALERALALDPELLLPGHGEPVVGRERVRRRLTEYRDAVRHVHDAVVRGMNEGKDVATLMREIALPPGSHVGEFYGRVSWSVRGIYETYAGSFDGTLADLYPASAPAVCPELVRLAGGPGAIAGRAVALVESGDAVAALRLTDAALAADPAHVGSWQARLGALERLRSSSGNAIESRLLDRGIEEARAAARAAVADTAR